MVRGIKIGDCDDHLRELFGRCGGVLGCNGRIKNGDRRGVSRWCRNVFQRHIFVDMRVALLVWVENGLCALRRRAFIVVVVGCRFVWYVTAPAVEAAVVADVVKLHRNPL